MTGARLVAALWITGALLAPASATSFRSLYSFTGGSAGSTDGATPQGTLVLRQGILYGTTKYGGSTGNGTIFAFNPATKQEAPAFTFDGAKFGEWPDSVATFQGAIVAATPYGGFDNVGTITAYDPSRHTTRLVYSFGVAPDAAAPNDLLPVGKTLYGVAAAGGANGSGTIFAVDPRSGGERVVYDFASGGAGFNPQPSLAAAGGMLYGVTEFGGYYGVGTLFRLDPATGGLALLHVFAGSGHDGFPTGLIYADGKLFGTTAGEIFRYDLAAHRYDILYNFTERNGGVPNALTWNKGALIGTLFAGGAHSAGSVFGFDPLALNFRTLHAFTGADGSAPAGALLWNGSAFYGTTTAGGTAGAGTIFEITP